MVSKGSKLYSIFNNKCPECHEGDFFLSKPYHFATIGEMYENCPSCGLKYSKEPGFYYGAMYITYSLGTAIFVSVWLLTVFLRIDITIFQIFLIIAGILILGTPYLYHLSKIIWANLFFHFKL